MGGWMDGWTDGWENEKMDGWMDISYITHFQHQNVTNYNDKDMIYSAMTQRSSYQTALDWQHAVCLYPHTNYSKVKHHYFHCNDWVWLHSGI